MTSSACMKRSTALPLACVFVLCSCTTSEDAWLTQPDWRQRLSEADQDQPQLPDTPRVLATDRPDVLRDKLNAEGPLALSIEEAIFLAMRNNRDLQVQQVSPVITGLFERIERGVFDPVAFAELQFARETASEIDRGTGAQFSVESEESRAIAGVRQNLPGGTELELSVAQNRDSSNRAPEQQDARLGLTVTQQLLRGAGPAVTLARLRQAELDTQASQYVLRGYAEALLAEVETTYWRYALATEQIAIFDRSLEVAKAQLDVVNRRIEVGALAQIESAAAKAEVARRNQALIDARSEREAQRLRLLRLINAPTDRSLSRSVDVTTSANADALQVGELDERLKLAAGKRPELAEARLRLEQGRLETIITRNGVLPRLEVFVALGKSGFADTISDSFRELDSENYDASAGVRLSQALSNDAARARNQIAYASRMQAAAAITNLEQLIELDVRLAVNEAERAAQQISASATTSVVQAETAQAEEKRFEAGTSTTLLVAQAQRDQLEAQINAIQAIVEYRIALIRLYLAEGTLLERRGFVIE